MPGYREALMDAYRMAQAAAQREMYLKQDLGRAVVPGGAGFTPSPQEQADRDLRLQELLSGASLRGGTQTGPNFRAAHYPPMGAGQPPTSPVSWGGGPSTGPQRPPQRRPQAQPAGPPSDRPWLSEEGYGPLTGSTNPEADAILRAMTEERMMKEEAARKVRLRQMLEDELDKQELQQRLEGLGRDRGPRPPGLSLEHGFTPPGGVWSEDAATGRKIGYEEAARGTPQSMRHLMPGTPENAAWERELAAGGGQWGLQPGRRLPGDR